MCRKLACLTSLALVLGLILTSAAEALDPIGWWQLDDGSGLSAADSLGEHDGELTGPLTWVEGIHGGALQFEGGNGSPFVDLGAWQTDGPDGLSLCLWAKWDGTNGFYQGFLSQREGTMYWWTELDPGGTQLRFKSNTSPQSNIYLTPEHLIEGEWAHLAFVHDATENTGTIYLNGEERLSGDWDLPAGDFSNLRIGIGVVNTADGLGTFNGALDDVMIFQVPLSQDEVLAAMEGRGAEHRPKAFGPNPKDGTVLVVTWANISWKAGDFAVSHDLYFGTSFDDVNDGAEGTFVGNLAMTNQVVGFPSFPAPDGLQPGTTYYWRVDEVNDADPNSPWKGDIWSFSVPPRTAYLPVPVDGGESVPLNVRLTWSPGFEAKLHTVYFGDNFDDVNNAAGGPLLDNATFTPPGPLELAKTYYWRVDEFNPPNTYKGVVWSFRTEGTAADPIPTKGAVDVSPTPILTWSAADLAGSHEIYFGTDADAVANASKSSPEYRGSQSVEEETFAADRLELMTTYYWRVDEVNSAEPGSPWIGNVWSFTTGDFLVVDDFEAHNDIDPPDEASNRIFDKWIDGFGTTTNGALVGNDLPPYAEQTIVHGGAQSMIYRYGNAGKTSEATLTLVWPRDWTEEGVTKLSIWHRGASANAPDRLFVALNGTAVVYHDDSAATQLSGWREWVIELAAFGVDLTNVNTITIGAGTKNDPSPGGGTGTLYFDDIRLYR